MAIKYEKIAVGDVLWDVHSQQAGNTTMRRLGAWEVRIVEIVPGGARVSWNSNAVQFWPRRRLEKLYRKLPLKYLKQRGSLLR